VPPGKDIDEAALRRVYKTSTLTISAIAAKFGISPKRVARSAEIGKWKRQHEPVSRRSRTHDFDLDAVRRDYEAGDETVRAVAAKYGISSSTLYALVASKKWRRVKRGIREGSLILPKALREAQTQRVLLTSLYDALGAEIRALASRSDAQGEGTKQIDQLARCMKTLHDLQGALGGPDEENDDARSDDEIRQSIERKLARFLIGEGFEEEIAGMAAPKPR
jgi:transposase-like protein